MRRTILYSAIAFLFLAATLVACTDRSKAVVVYTALDEMYARPILDDFEAETGIKVLAVYDTEAAKTTGLVTRLVAERHRPRADVFWNNEVAQSIQLAEMGLFMPYHSPNADAIPDAFKDATGLWTGFAARARVIIYNTELVDTPPTSIHDFLRPEWKGRAAIALPLFGTTATHAAALFAAWGPDKAQQFFLGLKANKVAMLSGNSAVRDLVARGEFAIGLTDTDDANGGIEDGYPVRWLLPDQTPHEGQSTALGTLVLPNTLGLVSGAPNPDAGRQLIDYLLRPAVESRLSAGRSIQIPLNPTAEVGKNAPIRANIKTMSVTFLEIAQHMEQSSTWIREEFVR